MPATTLPPVHGSYLMPSLDHATVADAMHPGILTCSAGAPLTEVARLMAAHHVHCIAVMGLTDQVPHEKLVWGIITDLDLIRAGIAPGPERTAGELALAPVLTVELTTPLRDVAELLLARNTAHAVVIDADRERPTGMLSTLDIAGVLAWGEA